MFEEFTYITIFIIMIHQETKDKPGQSQQNLEI